MRVKKTKATKSDLFSELDLFTGSGIPVRERKELADEIGELIIDETLKAVGNTKSPLKNKPWPALSKKYAKFKKSNNLPAKPNLEFQGDLLDALTYETTRSGVKIGYIGSSEAPKADGHNNFSGKSQIPTRQFLPAEGDKFRSDIDKKIREIIAEAKAKSAKLPKSRLRGVTTKAEFFRIMQDEFQGFSRREISDAIRSNPDLLDELDDLDLLDMLE